MKRYALLALLLLCPKIVSQDRRLPLDKPVTSQFAILDARGSNEPLLVCTMDKDLKIVKECYMRPDATIEKIAQALVDGMHGKNTEIQTKKSGTIRR